jgi:lysozyme
LQSSERLVEAIKVFEGLLLTAKEDTGGKQEIGYGHDLLPGESYPDGIGQGTADSLLAEDLATCDAHVNGLGWILTQGQHDALADFTYECGPGALRQLSSHGQEQAPEQLPRWVHASVNGAETVLPGMVARRAAEVEWWNE